MPTENPQSAIRNPQSTPPEFTVAIATLNDSRGLWFTVQSLLTHHAEPMRNAQLVVVDQDPDSAHGRANANLVVRALGRQGVRDGQLHSAQYVPLRNPRGIGPARNALFAAAAAEIVLVLDSHVLLIPDAVARLLEYFSASEPCRDLLIGPLRSDAGEKFVGTHQELVWRRDAWGIWANDPRLQDTKAEPLEVPMQGLGLFACRRDAFPGFHPEQRGFGCAEAVFCEKFRRRGDRVMCLPFLQWRHCFLDGEDKYEVHLVDRVANYLLELAEVEIDPGECLAHFAGRLNDADMAELLKRLKDAGVTDGHGHDRERTPPKDRAA